MKHAAHAFLDLCHVMAVLFTIILKIFWSLISCYRKMFYIHDYVTKWCTEAWYSGVEISHRIADSCMVNVSLHGFPSARNWRRVQNLLDQATPQLARIMSSFQWH